MKWKLKCHTPKADIKFMNKVVVSTHPLDSGLLDPLSSVLEGIDPLNSVLEGIDPLNDVSTNDPLSVAFPCDVPRGKVNTKSIDDRSPIGKCHSSWEEFRSIFLTKYKTKQQLSFTGNYMLPTETGQIESERIRAHLEKLDENMKKIPSNVVDFKEAYTQEQFIQHLNVLKVEMTNAWRIEERVKAFKIAIQCAKFLALSSPEMFYPCKFMVVTDILDELMFLVCEKVSSMANSKNPSFKFEIESMAKNWIYKVASVRELLPRLYLQVVLLPCYTLTKLETESNLIKRLLLMTRGIGDPVVSAYTRMYIIHIAVKNNISMIRYIQLAIEDLVNTLQWGWNGGGITEIELIAEDIKDKMVILDKIFSPPLMWLLQCLVNNCSAENLLFILKLAETSEDLLQYILIGSIVKTFPPAFLSQYSLPLLRVIDNCYFRGPNHCVMFTELATAVFYVPPQDDDKLVLLNYIMEIIVKYKNIDDYLQIATPWLRFAVSNLSCYKVDQILSVVLKRLSKNSVMDSSYLPLFNLVNTIVTYTHQPEILFTMSSFQGLLSIFQRERINVGVGKSISVMELKKLLENLLEKHIGDLLDASVIQLFLSLFSSLHDGINALTTEDEKRQIANLINSFILRVNFGRDFEHQFQFYVDVRASFSSLDSILEALLQQVCRIQMETYEIMKRDHSARTASFERACTSFSFITIPSLSSPFVRLRLYLLCGSVAMVNNCMAQGDACIKSAIKEIVEISVEKSTSNSKTKSLHLYEEIISAVAYLTCYLVAIPDPPEAAKPFYLFKGLLNALKGVQEIDEYVYACCLLGVIKGIISCICYELPYHLKGVDGTDSLFGENSVLIEEAENICSELLIDLVGYLKRNNDAPDDTSVNVAYELMNIFMIYFDLKEKENGDFANYLKKYLNKNVKLKIDIMKRYENIVKIN